MSHTHKRMTENNEIVLQANHENLVGETKCYFKGTSTAQTLHYLSYSSFKREKKTTAGEETILIMERNRSCD